MSSQQVYDCLWQYIEGSGKLSFMKGCQILAEITTQNTAIHENLEPVKNETTMNESLGKNMGILGYSIVLAYP